MAGSRIDNRLQDRLVVLIGGSGFLGGHLAQELLARGARLRMASRHPEHAYFLKTQGNLGQVQFVRCNVTRPVDVAAAMLGADAVINLVGAFAGDLDALQGSGAGRIAAAARAAGAGAFVHVSAIGADPESSVAYARSKADGEAAVRAAFPEATILRPSILFGPDDQFLNMFGGLIAALPALPVFAPTAKLQPLFVDDAALAAVHAVADVGAHGGKLYEIAGPEIVTMFELNQRIAEAQNRRRLFMPLPDAFSAAIATLTGWLPWAPLTTAQWKLLQPGNLASGQFPGLAELGISPRPLSLFLDRWMVRYRQHGRFGARTRSAA
ncbi:MAG: complex I NDUFA9 subunit family protein [Pseudomonadota bacterium]|nr:complex I NDUFA9 subunit family protein [Pseudomonadota bacterium]